MTRPLSVLVALLILPAIAMSDDASPFAAGAKLEKLAEGFKFTEGPAADAKGNVYFTDQPNDRILKYDTDGKLTTWMQPCGRSNGLCSGPTASSGRVPMKRTNCGLSTWLPRRTRWSWTRSQA